MVAKRATKIPDGIVEPVPSLLRKTASGPQSDVTATAIHIAEIARDAQASRARSSIIHPRSGTVSVGECERVAMSHLLPGTTLASRGRTFIRVNADASADGPTLFDGHTER
jgi:hypothetical protein